MIAQLLTTVPPLIIVVGLFFLVRHQGKMLEQFAKKPFTIIPRRGLASEWTAANPVLQPNELAVEEDTRKIKIGDGVTAWNDLAYEAELMPKRLVPNIYIYKGA